MVTTDHPAGSRGLEAPRGHHTEGMGVQPRCSPRRGHGSSRACTWVPGQGTLKGVPPPSQAASGPPPWTPLLFMAARPSPMHDITS